MARLARATLSIVLLALPGIVARPACPDSSASSGDPGNILIEASSTTPSTRTTTQLTTLTTTVSEAAAAVTRTVTTTVTLSDAAVVSSAINLDNTQEAVIKESTTSSEPRPLTTAAVKVVSTQDAVVTESTDSSEPETTTIAAQSSSAAASAKDPVETKASSITTSANKPVETKATSKLGIGWPIQERSVQPIQQFFGTGSKVSWWYDWNKDYTNKLFAADSTSLQVGGEFVPMMYDSTFPDNGRPLHDGWNMVMGFNEPDLTAQGATVATHMEPGAAAVAWKSMVDKLRGENAEAEFISPGVASNKTWLQDFYAAVCPPPASATNTWQGCNYVPTYTAVHVYTTDVEWLKTVVQDFHKTFGRPVILSEFAAYTFGSKQSLNADDTSKFMREATEWLDTQDFVARYAWFGTARDSTYLYEVAETNRLMDQNGALTPLGKQYVAGGH